jgi:hypothetical protein
MKTNIISPSEVVAVAFSDGAYLPPEVIAEEDIAVAVARWITPVVGEGVLQAVAEGKYPELKSDYLLPAIAHHTRLLVQPRLNCATTPMGATVVGTSTQRLPTDPMLRGLMRSLRERARHSLKRLSAYMDASSEQIAEYKTKCNVLKRCSCDGGFVQVL